MPRVIAFAGNIAVGKTFFANLIKDRAWVDFDIPNVKILSFAEPLKRMFAQVEQIPKEYLYLRGIKDQYRERLETYSNICKAHDKFIFTNKLIHSIQPEDFVIIDDLRLFELELQPLLEAGASCYRLVADEAVRKSRGANPTLTDNSIFEKELDFSQETWISLTGNPFISNNTDKPEDLYGIADELIRKHFLPVKC